MARLIVVLSGPVASGKSTLCDLMEKQYGFIRFKTQNLIRTVSGAPLERIALQKAGERLDRETGGKWVAKALGIEISKLPPDSRVLVDSVRIEQQIDAIRQGFGPEVNHVHLTAPESILADRYKQRSGKMKELASYAKVRANRTESRVETLADKADIVINTSRNIPADVLVRVASHLGLYGRGIDRLVDVLIGGQYGSEGKGNIASYLAREYDVLVRVGGANAGHKVYELPKAFTHHHLPSGTRRANAKIILGPGAVLHIPKLLQEVSECELSKERLFIDPQAMIVEDADLGLEAKSLKRTIASTAQGVGSATARKALRSAAKPSVRLARDTRELQGYLREAREVLDESYARGEKIFLEGTQGTGLSLHHGDYPFVTSRDTAVSGCLSEAGIAPSRVRKIIMVCRTYPIRVQNPTGGTSGPMGIEIDWKDVAERSGIPVRELRKAERTSTTNRKRRVAEFNWTLLRKAASLNGPTDIALTFADHLAIHNRQARRFEQLSPETIKFIEEVERVSGAPVSLISTRFHFRSIIDRRAW